MNSNHFNATYNNYNDKIYLVFVRKALFIIVETTNIMKINICMFFSVKSLKVGNTCRIYMYPRAKWFPPPSRRPKTVISGDGRIFMNMFVVSSAQCVLRNETEPKGEKLWLKYVKLILKAWHKICRNHNL